MIWGFFYFVGHNLQQECTFITFLSVQVFVKSYIFNSLLFLIFSTLKRFSSLFITRAFAKTRASPDSSHDFSLLRFAFPVYIS